MSVLPTDRDVFKLAFIVNAEDIDDLNHVNNVVYLGWVQNAASAHWSKVASTELRSQCMWVVLRHEIDYQIPAVEGDEVEAFTWVDPPNGPKQFRYVSIQRAKDQKVLAHAKSTWCLLDPTSGKPKRISEEIADAFRLKEGK
jgi:acyl-CoA thioester hydrolase